MPAKTSRARTDEQKLFRRQAILDAADQHFRDVGFEGFSMSRLAKQAEVAKGTLYLYFATREEMLLALCITRLRAWAEAVKTLAVHGMSDKDFATMIYETALADETMMPLLIRLDLVIEHNVAIDKLVESKREMRVELERLAEISASVLDLNPHRASDVVRSFATLLIGATRVDQGPSFEDEDLPEDIREFMNAFSSEELFTTNACHILAGIRANR